MSFRIQNEEAEKSLFRLVERHGVALGCMLYSSAVDPRKTPPVLLEAHMRRIRRLSKRAKLKHRRPDQAREVDDEALRAECQAADAKLAAVRAAKRKYNCRRRLKDLVNREQLNAFARAYLDDAEAECQSVAFKYLDRYLELWLREIIPTVLAVSREKSRSRLRSFKTVFGGDVIAALMMNGDPFKISQEAAKACDTLEYQ